MTQTIVLTPMMAKWKELKAKHEGMIVLLECGDFYEAFFDDAMLIDKELGLQLIERNGVCPMSGFPRKMGVLYLNRLLKKGHRVALCHHSNGVTETKDLHGFYI